MKKKEDIEITRPVIEPSILLVDGNYFLHRVMHTPAFLSLQTLEGRMTGGVYGVIRTIHATLKVFPTCGKCFVCWDGGRSRRREHLLPDYKKNRDEDPDATLEEKQEKAEYTKNFEDQKKELQRGLGFLGIRQLELPDREADDLIGWVTLNLPEAKVVVTEDRDLLQLVYPYCSIFQPMKEVCVTAENFQETTGVPVNLFLLSKALSGDKSDNIPGIPKVGDTIVKRVMKKVLEIWDGAERLSETLTKACHLQAEIDTRNRARYGSIVEHMADVGRNLQLVSIRQEVATFRTEEGAALQDVASQPCHFNQIGALSWLGDLEFQSIIGDFSAFTERFGVLR